MIRCLIVLRQNYYTLSMLAFYYGCQMHADWKWKKTDFNKPTKGDICVKKIYKYFYNIYKNLLKWILYTL